MSRAAAAAIGLGIVLRLAVFPFAENKHGDAPMRALVAERMVLEPTSAAAGSPTRRRANARNGNKTAIPASSDR